MLQFLILRCIFKAVPRPADFKQNQCQSPDNDTAITTTPLDHPSFACAHAGAYQCCWRQRRMTMALVCHALLLPKLPFTWCASFLCMNADCVKCLSVRTGCCLCEQAFSRKLYSVSQNNQTLDWTYISLYCTCLLLIFCFVPCGSLPLWRRSSTFRRTLCTMNSIVPCCRRHNSQRR